LCLWLLASLDYQEYQFDQFPCPPEFWGREQRCEPLEVCHLSMEQDLNDVQGRDQTWYLPLNMDDNLQTPLLGYYYPT